jgi:hypothetical protein
MALAMALACLANSNHSETSAVGAPSDHYHGPTAARWQSFVVTELADRCQRPGSVRARAKDAGMSNSVDTFEPGCGQNLAR